MMYMNEVCIDNLIVVSQMIGMCVNNVNGSLEGWTMISILSD